MLFQKPSDQVLYTALLERDANYDGRFYVGVTSTGVFCRLTCPARKPKLVNCCFFELVSQCIEEGFRPCKRCHPLRTTADGDPAIRQLLAALEQSPAKRWSESHIVAMGFDPSTVRRSFKRHFGMTFLEMARHRRLREGLGVLAKGEDVIDAQQVAGFESASGFRDALARLLGQSPASLKTAGPLRADCIETPLGPMLAVCDEQALHLLEFFDRKALPTELKKLRQQKGVDLSLGRFAINDQLDAEIDDYFAGKCADFKTPLALHGSAFTLSVWAALRDIPAGQTRSYRELADALERPSATRAVARANGANQISLIIPCHRVLGSDGSLTGYGGGLWRKQKLISLERQYGTTS